MKQTTKTNFNYNLLHDNKHALQAAHAFKQFDFTKDFTILEIQDKWTFNSITKLIEQTTNKKIKDLNIMLFYNYKRWQTNELYLLDFDLDHYNFNNEPGYYRKAYKYNIERFYSKQDLEHARKKADNLNYCLYIIIQNIEYKTKINNNDEYIKINTRYKNINRTCYNYFTNNEINTNYRYINLDKSGYAIDETQKQLKYRVNDYKEIKDKNKVDVIILDDLIEYYTSKYNYYKNEIINLINNDIITYNSSWALRDLSNLKKYLNDLKINYINKSFKSTRALDWLKNDLKRYDESIQEYLNNIKKDGDK